MNQRSVLAWGRWSRRAAPALVLALAFACGKVKPDETTGGETHWLRACTSDAECGGELSCVCRVCTESCSDDASCQDIAEQAVCRARSTTPYANGCDTAAPARLCAEPESTGEPDDPELVPLEGRRFDAQRGCFGSSEVAGTSPDVTSDTGCTGAETHAIAPSGECWLFPSGCLPDGFREVGSNGASETPPPCRFTSALCEEPTSCSAGLIPTPSGCLSCEDARTGLADYVTNNVTDSGWRACSIDADCVVEDWSSECDGQCGMPIASSAVAEFRAAVDGIARVYCPDPEPWVAVSCFARNVDCPIEALCRNGQCERVGVRCEDRTLEACASDGDCVVSSGFPYDANLGCLGAPVPIACVDPDLSCPPTTYAALDQNGACFMFGNCLPPGFSNAPENDACTAAASAAPCNPP